MIDDHWVSRYLGMKWTHRYNCFDHFCDVQNIIFRNDVSNVPNIPEFKDRDKAIDFVRSNQNGTYFMEVPYNQRKEGDAIIFGTKDVSFHVGTYVQSKGICGVLHCDMKEGVILTSMQSIRNSGKEFCFMRCV